MILDPTMNQFKFENIRVINDFYERYKLHRRQMNLVEFKSNWEFYLTDNREILYVNKSQNIIMFEEIEWQNDIYQKLGKKDLSPDLFKDLADIVWVPKNGGFAFFSEWEVYFLKIDSVERIALPLIKVNFRISKSQMIVNQVWACIDPSLIVISLKNKKDSLLIVWNIDENKEVSNYSTSKKWMFINGPKNKAGFILTGDVYLNLDWGLANHFFEYDFKRSVMKSKNGYRITQSEDRILENGWLITKQTIVELCALDELIHEKFKIDQDSISLERIRFQVDGNTSLHYYALEYDTLNLILEYFDNHK